MRFVVDAQLPAALARTLTGLGHTAEHVSDFTLGDAPDHLIWEYALKHKAVIISKDSDFPDLAILRDVAPQVIWIRAGNTRKQALLDWFLPQLETVIGLLKSGTGIIELR